MLQFKRYSLREHELANTPSPARGSSPFKRMKLMSLGKLDPNCNRGVLQDMAIPQVNSQHQNGSLWIPSTPLGSPIQQTNMLKPIQNIQNTIFDKQTCDINGGHASSNHAQDNLLMKSYEASNQKDALVVKVKTDSDPDPSRKPISKYESTLSGLEAQRIELIDSIKQLKETLNSKLDSVLAVKKQIIETRAKRLKFDHLEGILTMAQKNLRSALNEVYNNGLKAEERAKSIFEEMKKSHRSKLEAIKFELNHDFDAAQKAIVAKDKELLHDLEITERIILTHKHHRAEEEKKLAGKPNAAEEPKSTDGGPAQDGPISCQESEDFAEQDCVIIEESICEHPTDPDMGSKTPETLDAEPDDVFMMDQTEATTKFKADKISEDKGHDSQKSVSDEATEIEEEEEEEDEVERSFTPCQAQRLN